MWTQIVGGLALLIVGTYVVQLFAPRSRSSHNRTSAHMDFAPALGFFGVLLLALSLVESIRQSVMQAWAVGIALGFVLGIGTWIVLVYPKDEPKQKKQSALLATLRLVRTYGMPLVLAVIGTYLAIRIFGSAVEVFVAGTFGVLLVTIALRIFVGVKKVSQQSVISSGARNLTLDQEEISRRKERSSK